jgi:hypothetical protein
MKTVVKTKMPAKRKPGDLRASHIEYDSEGDGATVSHEHEPEPGKKGDPWGPGPAIHKKSFGSRKEALHHMAQTAGVPSEMVEGDPNEDPNEDQGNEPNPGAAPQMTAA